MVCRHGSPLRYLNLYQGERMELTYTLLKDVVAQTPHATQWGLMYDVGYRFHQWLQRRDMALSAQMTVSIKLNAFYIYAHELPCQMKYGPRQTVNWGLSDGEGNERDWSDKRHLVGPGRYS
ncbi:hypothetical protein BGX38DRAFT_1071313, partial [Terfezia claveryi]